MKNKFIIIALLGASSAFMAGCQTTRTATITNQDYNTVFKSAVSGLCSEKKLLVYQADKAKGVIWVQGRGIFANPPETPVMLVRGTNTTTARVTLPGMDNSWADRIIALITENLPAAKTEPAVSKTPGSKTLEEGTDVGLEREKLELEKEKLKFEREKLEFEKQKQKGK